MTRINAIVAVDRNGNYKQDGKSGLPWPRDRGDHEWFNHIVREKDWVVWGSVTSKDWSTRKNQIVYSRLGDFHDPKVVIDYFLEKADEDANLYVCGGKAIWEAFEPFVDNVYETVIKGVYTTVNNSNTHPYRDYPKIQILETEKYRVNLSNMYIRSNYFQFQILDKYSHLLEPRRTIRGGRVDIQYWFVNETVMNMFRDLDEIHQTCQRVGTPVKIEIGQIKTKFGSGRVYADVSCTDEKIVEKVRSIIDDCENTLTRAETKS